MNPSKLPNCNATPFNAVLQELKTEAESLFETLDTFSSQIIDLEKNLQALKANFPFKKEVGKETGAFIYRTKPEHSIDFYEARHYYNSICWYIAWDIDANSKEFRLFLISEKQEIVYYTHPSWDNKIVIFKSEVLKKQPLIETKLASRLNYFGHLLEFLNAFTKHLNDCHKSIAQGAVEPFKVNDSLDTMLRRHDVLDAVQAPKECLGDIFADSEPFSSIQSTTFGDLPF